MLLLALWSGGGGLTGGVYLCSRCVWVLVIRYVRWNAGWRGTASSVTKTTRGSGHCFTNYRHFSSNGIDFIAFTLTTRSPPGGSERQVSVSELEPRRGIEGISRFWFVDPAKILFQPRHNHNG
ncbi:hypothetical protein SAICODRAFT_119861 [Saitoella complicata NRRL Y-17804]|uniref:uncharacterized protein n=1 Tax=Saitoella complicata (strain BCRC 22490 / CBS 7301 / JCM 7358 / NBRC 10748 / NRRL Y-17804) TaxID=698492 RepID=UPI0008671BA6|nr:uncharacterized protein SAICODRAFT_119861 [Saitoella complicata NRRL Y-17804]ODQ53276.1 hypothetical protein SAICODRAFT_119861 [Saitoella complicata NRRL Y-17804]